MKILEEKTFRALKMIESKRKAVLTKKTKVMETARKRGIAVYVEPVVVQDLLKQEMAELKK